MLLADLNTVLVSVISTIVGMFIGFLLVSLFVRAVQDRQLKKRLAIQVRESYEKSLMNWWRGVEEGKLETNAAETLNQLIEQCDFSDPDREENYLAGGLVHLEKRLNAISLGDEKYNELREAFLELQEEISELRNASN